MRGKRYYVVSALLGLGTLAGCAADEPAAKKSPIVGDWGDPNKYPDIGGAFATLTALDGDCAFDAKAGAVTININDSQQTVVVAKRAVDSLLVINGDSDCNGVTVPTKNIKTVAITAATGTTDQNLVLDFIAGTFAAGAKGKAGITVKMDGGTDTVAVRGTSGKDAFAAGATGVASGANALAFNTDLFADVDLLGVENVTVSLAGGDDKFTGAGGYGTGAAFPNKLTVYGGSDKDTLTGGDGDDEINGGDGDDTLAGGAGDDEINGDGGNDIVDQGADPDGADVIVCGDGTGDKVSYALRGDATDATVEKVNVSVGTAWHDDDSDANTPDVPQDPNDGDIGTSEGDDVGTSCEIVVGGMGHDILMGDAEANTLYGGPGNDVLNGGEGDDTLYGEAGDDVFDETLYEDGDSDGLVNDVATTQAATGADKMVGGTGTDTVDYGNRTGDVTVVMDGDPKTLLGTAGGEDTEGDIVCNDVENLYGGFGDDSLTGNALNNTIRGNEGADEMYGLAGDDTFDEGLYEDGDTDGFVDDLVSTQATTGADTIAGGLGVDTVDYSTRTADLSILLDASSGSGEASEGDTIGTDVENVKGGEGADTITGNASDNDVDGGDGADIITGAEGNDTLFGGAGDDTIDGGDGDDTIDGGGDQSASYLTCGAGDDIAFNGTVDPAASPADESCELLL